MAVLHASGQLSQRAGEDDGDDDDGRRQRQDDQQQVGAEDEEHDDGTGETEHRREQRGQRLRQHRAHLGDIARQAGDQLAHTATDVEVKLQRHQPIEDLGTHAGHDALTDDAQGPRLHEASDGQDQRDQRQHEQQLVESGGIASADDLAHEVAHDAAAAAGPRRSQMNRATTATANSFRCGRR